LNGKPNLMRRARLLQWVQSVSVAKVSCDFYSSPNMKVSIVVPTFNQGEFIRFCLDSILSQSFADFEIIIQDALSSDDTQAICKQFASLDSRVRYFREMDLGQSDAINKGLSRSRGEFWTWLCSDDIFIGTDALEDMINEFETQRRQDVGVVGIFGNSQFISPVGGRLNFFPTRFQRCHRDTFKKKWPFQQPGSLLLKDRVSEVNGVNVKLSLGMDLDLFIRMLEGGRTFAPLQKLIAGVRIQPNSKTVKFGVETAVNALMIVRHHFGGIGFVFSSDFARSYGYNLFEALKSGVDWRRGFSSSSVVPSGVQAPVLTFKSLLRHFLTGILTLAACLTVFKPNDKLERK
jgi:glycosyltransferase involved in cell wall biosynthesis